MKTLLYIFLGGGFGSILRFLVSDYTQKLWNVKHFPLGTFTVNILGCFLVGAAAAYFMKVDSTLKFLMITGFCGGFTTFSTFSLENMTLWQEGHYSTLFAYIFLSVALGFLAVYSGFTMLKR